MHTAPGIAITAVTVLILVIAFLRHQRFPLPARGWIGVTLLVTAEALMFGQVWPVNVYFTPIAWTAYLLIADSMVQAITGMSRVHNSPRDFLLCAALSTPLWTIFELYNLRLANWTYVGVPVSWAGALLGYAWSFATITPGILETADLIEAIWPHRRSPDHQIARSPDVRRVGKRAVQFSPHTDPRVAHPSPTLARVGYTRIQLAPRTQLCFVLFGAACLIIPLVTPQHVAAYLFALVWVGFVFLLDPINYWRGLPSLIGDLAAGRRARLYSLLLSGWVCGWLWEFWNNWAAAKWHYIFPIGQDWKIFEMPAPGFLGFLPFALECFVMYVSASAALGARARSVSRSRELTRE